MQTNLHIISARLRQTMATLPQKAGVIMVAFSKDRFKYQNWTDTGTVMWQRRSRKPGWSNKGKRPNNAGRAILHQGGHLRRSIRVVATTANSVTIGSDMPYARIHNDGGLLNARQRVRAHVRVNKKRDVQGITGSRTNKAGTRTNIKWGKTATGISHVKAHDRYLNFRMPRRRFMGNSMYLNKQISRMIGAEINKIFKV